MIFCVSWAVANTVFTHSRNRSARVLSDEIVQSGKYPFSITVSLQNYGRHFCTGSIYGLEHVITAATCVQGLEPRDIEIVTDTVNLNEKGTVYRVKKIISKKPNGENSVHDDIALLRTSEQMTLGDTAMSCHLAKSDVLPTESREVFLVGWSKGEVSRLHFN